MYEHLGKYEFKINSVKCHSRHVPSISAIFGVPLVTCKSGSCPIRQQMIQILLACKIIPICNQRYYGKTQDYLDEYSVR